VPDQAALARAARDYDAVCPLFVFDPQFYDDGIACDSRLRFLHHCLDDLRAQYRRRGQGTTLVFAHSDPGSVLGRFTDAGWDVVATADPSGRYGYRRDERLARERDVMFVADDGLQRAGDSRDGWSDHAERYLEADPTQPELTGLDPHGCTSDVSTEAVERQYGIEPTKTRVPTGGREAALDRVETFRSRLGAYPGSISAPAKAEDGTSRLSAHLRFGCLSVRELYRAVADADPGRARELFVSRLYWNRHYTQKLEDWPGWMEHAVNPVFRGFNRDRHDPDLVAAWKAGETGFPMVDASMRCLRETGWLNFRMRAMCASFFGTILRQPWKLGADWFYHHLIDADPAINYTQWQQQTGVTGINTNRIYNPRKQVRDNDPDGEFVHEWVPELRSVPPAHLDRPERIPLHLQEEFGVTIGEDYPRPVVDYDARRQAAMETFSALEARAHEALSDPEIRRRASLSRRGRGPSEEPSSSPSPTDQTDLSEFD
jgi:deoxyribodipyrimidine photo-lyase